MNLKQAQRKARKLWGARGVVSTRCGERVVAVLRGEGHIMFLEVKGAGITYAAAFEDFERTERHKAFAAKASYCQLCEAPFAKDKDERRPVWLLTEHQDYYVCGLCHDTAKFGRRLKPKQRDYVHQMRKAQNPDVPGPPATYHLRVAQSHWNEMTMRDRRTVVVVLRDEFECPVHDDPSWEQQEEKA